MKTERPISPTWLVPGCAVAQARCFDAASVPAKKGAPVDVILEGRRTVLDVFKQDSTRSTWGVQEARDGFPPVSGLLDQRGSCVSCGRAIVRTHVSELGEVMVGH
ncbi:MAG: hypothetical protein ABIR28_13600 [Vicinamibacteria bacterium]